MATIRPAASRVQSVRVTPLSLSLADKPIVLVGLMGAGKTCVGRRLARRLDLPFTDADDEIQKAAGCSIEDIFRIMGESAFRSGERRVIARLLGNGPQVLATGGGAFIDAETRARIKAYAVSVWLRADLDTLFQRTQGRSGRPLLASGDPRAILESLIAVRYPIYAEADITIDTGDESIDSTVGRTIAALKRHAVQAGQPASQP